MGTKKAKSKSNRFKPTPDIDWRLATKGVPVCQVFADFDLSTMSGLESAVEAFLGDLEDDRYLVWEGVIKDEQDLPLTPRQEELVDELLAFGDEDDVDEERILYINEIERPSRPWYEDLRQLAPHLLTLPLRSDATYFDVQLEGWQQIVDALDEHGAGLSLPPGIEQPLEAVPADVRHRLWIQSCCEPLMGIGTYKSYSNSLSSPDDQERVTELVESLREHRDSVEALGLTLERLREFLLLPGAEQGLFEVLLTKALGLTSAAAPLAPNL